MARKVQDDLSGFLCTWMGQRMYPSTQVLIFVGGEDKNCDVYEELLDIKSIHGTPIVEYNFKAVEKATISHSLDSN